MGFSGSGEMGFVHSTKITKSECNQLATTDSPFIGFLLFCNRMLRTMRVKESKIAPSEKDCIPSPKSLTDRVNHKVCPHSNKAGHHANQRDAPRLSSSSSPDT